MTTRRSADLHGILAAVTTPFTPDADRVDEATLQTQADWLIGAGVHGLVTTGTTGEFPTLTPQEYRCVIEAYVHAAAGRVPVVAGVGALSTRDAVDLAQHSERVGADAVMLLPPFLRRGRPADAHGVPHGGRRVGQHPRSCTTTSPPRRGPS
jgi:dihydrodipicolinate synthase/N-acetylneuraminate lyase